MTIVQKISICCGFTLLYWGALSCQTRDEKTQKNDLLYYSLREEKEISYTRNPNIYSYEISILAHYAGGETKTYRGFRLWDIDQNGKVDAIESLTGDLLPVRFDFDRDGLLEKKNE